MFPSNEAKAWENFEKVICPHMLLIFLAAAQPAVGGKVRDRLHGLLESWAEWEQEVVEAFELKPQIDFILRQLPVTQERTMTWGEWRKLISAEEERFHEWCKKNPGKPVTIVKDFNKRWWGFKDDPQKNNAEMLTLKTTFWPAFAPGIVQMSGIVESLKQARVQK